MTKDVPVSVSEISEDDYQAIEIRISMIHIHARDETTGIPIYSGDAYCKTIEGIRCISKELIICVSLSGRNYKEFHQRAEPFQFEDDLKSANTY